MKQEQRGRLLQQLRSVPQLPASDVQKCPQSTEMPPKDSACHASEFSWRISHSQAVSNAHVVDSCAPTSRNPCAYVCGYAKVLWNSLCDSLLWCLPWHACTRAHADSAVASPPHQRALACMSTATEAGQLTQLPAPRVGGEAVVLPSNTNFVVLVFRWTASHPWQLSVGEE